MHLPEKGLTNKFYAVAHTLENKEIEFRFEVKTSGEGGVFLNLEAYEAKNNGTYQPVKLVEKDKIRLIARISNPNNQNSEIRIISSGSREELRWTISDSNLPANREDLKFAISFQRIKTENATATLE